MLMALGICIAIAAWGATITLVAYAPDIIEINLSASSISIAVDALGKTAIRKSVDMFAVRSNKVDYTVTFASANGGVLQNSEQKMPYYIRVDTSSWEDAIAVNDLHTYTQLTSPKAISFTKITPKEGKSFPIDVHFPDHNEFYATGMYTDIIIISISQT